MKMFVVIPGYNEAHYLERVFEKVVLQTKHVIFVDDGSHDNSAEIAHKYTSHVLIHETNLGKGAAMMTGAQYAFSRLNADAVIFLDADDQHDPKQIPDFITQLNRYDVVFGVRNMGSNMPLFRFLGNKFASVLLNVLFGEYIPDIPSGYKAMTRLAYEQIKWKSSGYEVETEIAMRVAKNHIPFGIVETKSIYHDTDKGMTLLLALKIMQCLLFWRLGI